MTSCQEETIARIAVKSGIFSSQRTASMVATLLLTQFPVRLAAWLAAASAQSQKAGGSTQYTALITKHAWSLRSFLRAIKIECLTLSLFALVNHYCLFSRVKSFVKLRQRVPRFPDHCCNSCSSLERGSPFPGQLLSPEQQQLAFQLTLMLARHLARTRQLETQEQITACRDPDPGIQYQYQGADAGMPTWSSRKNKI